MTTERIINTGGTVIMSHADKGKPPISSNLLTCDMKIVCQELVPTGPYSGLVYLVFVIGPLNSNPCRRYRRDPRHNKPVNMQICTRRSQRRLRVLACCDLSLHISTQAKKLFWVNHISGVKATTGKIQ